MENFIPSPYETFYARLPQLEEIESNAKFVKSYSIEELISLHEKFSNTLIEVRRTLLIAYEEYLQFIGMTHSEAGFYSGYCSTFKALSLMDEVEKIESAIARKINLTDYDCMK